MEFWISVDVNLYAYTVNYMQLPQCTRGAAITPSRNPLKMADRITMGNSLCITPHVYGQEQVMLTSCPYTRVQYATVYNNHSPHSVHQHNQHSCLVRTLRHRKFRKRSLPEPEEADRPSVDDRDDNDLSPRLQHWERVRHARWRFFSGLP